MELIHWLGVALGLVVQIVFAVVCWNLARSRDRSRIGWFILGFFFSVIALIVLLIIGKKKPKAASS